MCLMKENIKLAQHFLFMHKMSNLEYFFLVNELAPRVVGKHFSRIRKIAEGIYRMKIGDCEIICQPGVRIHETRYLEEAAEPDKFVEKVEKELDNAKLISLEQVNNDRIVSFNFDKGSLVCEMFGDGNIILVRDGKTVCAYRYESWSDREIKAGSSYSPPKTVPSTKLELSEKYVIVSLTKLPLGKEYAMEALSRARIDEKKPGDQLSRDELARLERAISEIRSSARPYVFYHQETGNAADFALAPLSAYSDMEKKEFATLGEAADEYYTKAEQPNPRLEKLQKRLEKQREHLAELAGEEKENRAKGDFIYANYEEIEKLLGLAKSGKFEELEKKHKGKIDKKEKSAEVEI